MEILLMISLILANAFLSLAEVAVLTAPSHKLVVRGSEGDDGAKLALAMRANPSTFLSTIQLGITLIGLLAGAVSAVTLGTRLGSALVGWPVIGGIGTELGVVVSVLVVSYVWVVFGELVPKRIGLTYAEPIAVHVAPFIRTLDRLARYPVLVLAVSTRFVTHILGVRRPIETTASQEELAALATQAAAKGSIRPAERNLLDRVFRLSDRPVSEIMTPRPDIAFIDMAAPDKAIETVTATGHTTFPVQQNPAGEVLGMVHSKDLFGQLAERRKIDIQGIMQPAVFVPEVATIMQVVERMRSSGTHEVLVVDEQGVMQGMLSAHDVLEAIVGELPAPAQGDYAELVKRHDGTWLADGSLPTEELRATLGLEKFPGDELRHCETVGGVVMASLGRVPSTGDRMECASVTLEVVDMDGRRVDKVLVDPRDATRTT